MSKDREIVALKNGKVADLTDAEKWNEDTWWDGSNNVSLATGSQWRHETLYRTQKGNWIVWHTSNFQGEASGYRQLTPGEAAHWLVTNRHDLPESLSNVVTEAAL